MYTPFKIDLLLLGISSNQCCAVKKNLTYTPEQMKAFDLLYCYLLLRHTGAQIHHLLSEQNLSALWSCHAN